MCAKAHVFIEKKNTSLEKQRDILDRINEKCDTKNLRDKLCTKTKNTSLEKERDY